MESEVRVDGRNSGGTAVVWESGNTTAKTTTTMAETTNAAFFSVTSHLKSRYCTFRRKTSYILDLVERFYNSCSQKIKKKKRENK